MHQSHSVIAQWDAARRLRQIKAMNEEQLVKTKLKRTRQEQILGSFTLSVTNSNQAPPRRLRLVV